MPKTHDAKPKDAAFDLVEVDALWVSGLPGYHSRAIRAERMGGLPKCTANEAVLP